MLETFFADIAVIRYNCNTTLVLQITNHCDECII
jgi:hypothetical protein